MNNAKNIACDVLYRPIDCRFEEKIRRFQGCPTLAVTHKGRIYAGWYSGGVREPDMENYNLLIYSDDQGINWSNTLLVIPSSKENFVHALDIQLWTDPKGHLHVYWVQNNTKLDSGVLPVTQETQPLVAFDGYLYDDFEHAWWEIICENPDEENPIFSAPRYIGKGFLRSKPLVLDNGTWLCFNYDQIEENYGYSVSCDEGKTYSRCYGAKKLDTKFDEAMAYQKADGSIRMFARTWLGELAESNSYDNGSTWTEAKLSGIDNANTRFYISRTPSGKVLLVNNDDRTVRKNMTLYLSEDDGKTWKYKRCIDTREGVSYPDVDFYGEKIYLIYDRERVGAKEILFVELTEADIIDPSRLVNVSIISKP